MRIKEQLRENGLGDLTPTQNFLVFGSNNTVLCVDGKHFRPFDYDDWVECGELEDVQYTWYIPNVAGNVVKPGEVTRSPIS